jgi:hypothetical protein
MRALPHHLDWQALFLGFLAGYCVPVLLACVMPAALWHLWFWVLAPAAAGCVAAKLAPNLPLLHGLAVSVLGLLVFGLVSSPKPLATWVVWIAINVACSLSGAWLWRRYQQRTA